MAIGSMNVSNNSKINDEIKSLHDKDTELEDTLNTKANNDDIAVRSISKDYIQLTDAKDANMLLDHAPVNMLNITCTPQTVNGVTITVNPDKTIYVKGTATSEIQHLIGSFNVTKGQTFSFGQAKSVNGNVDDDGTSWNNYIYFKGYDGTSNWKFDGIFTATVTTDISCRLYVRSGTTVDCTYYPRVYYENKRHYYVPPAGFEIVSCGKNLVDVSNGNDGTWITLNCTVDYYKQKTIKLKPNTKYTISQETNKIYVTEGDAPWSWIFIQSGHASDKTNWCITSSNGCLSDSPRTITSDAEGYITIAICTGIDDNSKTIVDAKVQLEEGDTATTYEPFKGTSVSINKDTKFPLEGLKSLNGLTNIYNSYGVPMEVAYANNNSGKALLDKVSNNSDPLSILPNNAGTRNSIYRGNYLGDKLTNTQKTAIKNGTFEDLWVGDYWVINGVTWRIAHFDYWLNTGDHACTKHHVVIVPDTSLYIAKMNDTNITTGAYIGSVMYTANLASAKTTIENAFGSANILTHREYLANATNETTDPTYESVGSWYDSTVELMNECMVYGSNILHNVEVNGTVPSNHTIDKSQLALFRLDQSKICNREAWWLRDVVSSKRFAIVDYYGNAYFYNASDLDGVRPAFGIIG